MLSGIIVTIDDGSISFPAQSIAGGGGLVVEEADSAAGENSQSDSTQSFHNLIDNSDLVATINCKCQDGALDMLDEKFTLRFLVTSLIC